MNNELQSPLFKQEEEWRKEWIGMPEYNSTDKTAVKSLKVNFETFDDMKAFSDLIGYNITKKTSSIFYPPPKAHHNVPLGKIYIDDSDQGQNEGSRSKS